MVSAMGKPSRRKLTAALTKFLRKWKSVEILEKDFTHVPHKSGQRYFAALEKAKSTAAELIVRKFAPLAASVTDEIGLARFENIPAEPPYPVNVSIPGRGAYDLADTLDTNEAGRRILAWGAMAYSPERWNRADNFYLTVAKWAESLVYPLNSRGDWRLLHKPIQWAVAAAVRLSALVNGAAPDDLSAFVIASKLQYTEKSGLTTYKRLQSFLKKHPEIRTQTKGRRFWVHAGDWINYWASVDSADFNSLDASAKLVDQAATRKQSIVKKPGRRDRNL
jgi:hypothetical protein